MKCTCAQLLFLKTLKHSVQLGSNDQHEYRKIARLIKRRGKIGNLTESHHCLIRARRLRFSVRTRGWWATGRPDGRRFPKPCRATRACAEFQSVERRLYAARRGACGVGRRQGEFRTSPARAPRECRTIVSQLRVVVVICGSVDRHYPRARGNFLRGPL
jgi:hypothetical protein